MKKLFIAALFGLFVACCYGQDVRVNINNQDATKTDDCPYRINGICSSEDIGGVDFEVKTEGDKVSLVLTNYNTFPVTVLMEYEYYHPHVWFKETTSVVLGVNGVKKIAEGNSSYRDYRLVGMIVRKLAQ